MKLIKSYFLSLLLSGFAGAMLAQSPQAVNYQSVLRDANGEVIVNTAVGIQLEIRQGSATGAAIYSETHNPTTNDFGLVNLKLGDGTSNDDFSAIDWSSGPYFLATLLDASGGSSYSELGASELLSVPYALLANRVTNDAVDDADADTLNEIQAISWANDTLFLSNGGSVSLSIYNDSNAINALQSKVSSDSLLVTNALNNHISNDEDTDDQNEIQSLSLTGNTLAISNSNDVDLSGYLDNTDAQNLTSTSTGTNRTLNISGGTGATISVADNDNDSINEIQSLSSSVSGTNRTINISGSTGTTISVADNDNSTTNEIQTLSSSTSGTNRTVSISSGNSTTINVADNDNSSTNEIQTISKSGNTVTLSNSGGSFTDAVNDADASTTNEIQSLSFSGTSLSISSGNTVNLSALQDGTGTDDQDLSSSSSGTNRTINITGGNGTTINVADNDNSTSNEIQTLTLSGSTLGITGGNTVSLPSGGGGSAQNLSSASSGTNRTINISGGSGTTISVADNDNSASNELQTISKSGSTVTLSNGGGSFTDAVNDADASATNEIQSLSVSGSTLSISGGNSVSLPSGGGSPWTTASGNIHRSTGDVTIGATNTYNAKLEVYGSHTSYTAYDGAYIEVDGSTGNTRGVFAKSDGTSSGSNYGVLGEALGASTNNFGVRGFASGNSSRGGYFSTTGSGSVAVGVQGVATKTGTGTNVGAEGLANSSTATNYGGFFTGSGSGSGANYGSWSQASARATNVGAYSRATGTGSTNYGMFSFASGATNNYAGYFIGNTVISGNLTVTGSISKGSGTFKIDHPADPTNKYLVHSFVESPDMMNMYNGNIVTDGSGYATVELPSYFEMNNKDFRYQLTVIGSFTQAIVSEEVSGNTFVIQTSDPNTKVSWMVTGVRNDPYAQANRIEPEPSKEGAEVGTYLHPTLYGQDESMATYKNLENSNVEPSPVAEDDRAQVKAEK